jgi:hypothetical protein
MAVISASIRFNGGAYSPHLHFAPSQESTPPLRQPHFWQ